MGQGNGLPGGINLPGQRDQVYYPIEEGDAQMMRVPYFMPFEPAAAIGALATVNVDQVISWQDFVCTRIGFTSTTVGFPATAGRWKVAIQDIRSSRLFQPENFDITALVGANSGVSDSAAVEMPTPWIFLNKTTIRVTFEDTSGFGGTPHLLLIGYLTSWARDATAELELQKLNLAALKRAAAGDGWRG